MARRAATRDEERRAKIAGEPVDEVMTPHAATDDQSDEAVGAQPTLPARGAEAAASDPPPRARRGRPRAGGRNRGVAAAGAESAADSEAGTPPEQPVRPRGRRGSVAADTHAAVEALVHAEGLTRAQAFARVGADSGRRPATVAAAYYRAARRDSAVATRPGARGPGRRARSGRQGGSGATRALEAARDALEQLVALARRQEQELVQLRAESVRYAEIRAIIDGGSVPERRGRRRSTAA
jgi:hypothetical protein